MSAKGHLVGIDLLRFVAAAVVVLFHLGFWSWGQPGSTPRTVSGGAYAYPELTFAAWWGWVGVEIFFVVSGFVIVNSANSTAWAFLRSRILRLAPGAWACAPLSAACLLWYGIYPENEIFSRLIRSVAFWPKGPWVDGVYWTLGVEVAFYSLIFAMLIFRLTHVVTAMLCVLGSLSALFWLVFLLYPTIAGGAFFTGSRNLDLTLLPHGCFFAIGGLLWAILCNKASRWLWSIVALCVLGGAIEILHLAIPRALQADTPSFSYVPIAIWLVGICLIIASVQWSERLGAIVPSKLSRPIGLATYPLYLLHDVVGAATLRACKALGIGRWSALGASIVFVMIVSFVIALWLEPVLKNALRRMIDSRLFSFPRKMVDWKWKPA